jgi:precorrin-2/cobalt-factor-2 C20-methyltransferase
MACRLIAERLVSGRTVAFIALGDPLFYATSLYILEGMRRDYPDLPVEVVPGVSSIFAAAAEAAFPLAEGSGQVAILPATAGLESLEKAIWSYGTVIVMKVKPQFSGLMEMLEKYPEATLLFAQKVGMPGQVIFTDRRAIAAHTPDYLSLLIIRRS